MWNDRLLKTAMLSSFALSTTEIRKWLVEVCERGEKHTVVLEMEGQLYSVYRSAETQMWNDYAVLTVTRRGPKLFLAVAGLSGPTTIAAIQFSVSLPLEVPDAPVVDWAVVKVMVERKPRSGDNRE